MPAARAFDRSRGSVAHGADATAGTAGPTLCPAGAGGRTISAMTATGDSANEPLFCDRCGATLQPGSGNFYLVKIEAVCDPTPPAFSEEDLRRNPRGNRRASGAARRRSRRKRPWTRFTGG